MFSRRKWRRLHCPILVARIAHARALCATTVSGRKRGRSSSRNVVVEQLVPCKMQTERRCHMRSKIVGLKELLVGFTLTATSSCASTTPGAHPHDMSATQHEAMAAGEADVAASHATRYDPAATVRTEHCGGGRVGVEAGGGGCWTSTRNATSEHLAEAKKHQKMAADHRAASQALRDAEGSACVGITEADRDMSPFDHRQDIASVEPLTEGVTSGKAQSARTTGAVITFRAMPEMTAQWLQRVVDCHLARNAALGHDVPEMPFCPLVPKNVTARVTATNTGFAVAVRSDDTDTAREILKRAQGLVAH